MTPEEREDLLSNAPPEENLGAKYEHLLHAFEEQGRTMKRVASQLRAPNMKPGFDWGEFSVNMAQELDSPEPIAETDAAEKFSQDCANRKLTKGGVYEQD